MPTLTAFRQWLDELAPHVLPQSFTSKAITHALNQ